MEISDFIGKCNSLTSKGEPFLFMVDYDLEDFQLFPLEIAADAGVFYDIQGLSNFDIETAPLTEEIDFKAIPIEYNRYEDAFSMVRKHIFHGNSFLLNLTFPSSLMTNLSLQEIFARSSAKYKLLFKDRFTVFSPETFVKIKDGFIYSYPMKGTMDAKVPNAEKILLENEKEIWEHNTIVDLIRNDLSMVAKEVTVTKFRYIDRIKTHSHELLQVSSEIRGKLPDDWKNNIGNILLSLLPAGSICGAPKKKTLEIISLAEKKKRGFFTGVFGIYDGNTIDSAVMIRYIEKTPNGLQFRSGGGITGHSDPKEEYKEMIQKVYVPIV